MSTVAKNFRIDSELNNQASKLLEGLGLSMSQAISMFLKQVVLHRGKLFIERWYPFFKYGAPLMSNTSKPGKKGALVCSFWGSPVDVTEKYAEWTVLGFSQMGCDKTRAVLFPQIPEKGDVLKKDEYVRKIHALAEWLAE